LSISKAIVELHGGKIFASSAGADHGARFVIELPNVVSCTIERPSPQTAPIQKRIPNPRILLVDDHADSVRPMQLFLEASGYEVTTADTVATALRAATQHQFDLLVSDLGLPDGSGDDLIRQLQNNGRKLPSIALSGYGTEQDIARSRAAGFQVHLTKPVSPQDLRTTMDSLLTTGE
jgi:CheY-like chemotaxis protein